MKKDRLSHLDRGGSTFRKFDPGRPEACLVSALIAAPWECPASPRCMRSRLHNASPFSRGFSSPSPRGFVGTRARTGAARRRRQWNLANAGERTRGIKAAVLQPRLPTLLLASESPCSLAK
jgi:hypothetical protein